MLQSWEHVQASLHFITLEECQKFYHSIPDRIQVILAFDLKSTLVNVEVIARYLLTKEKLRKYLKPITLEDHQWHLRFLYHNFVGVVNMYCAR